MPDVEIEGQKFKAMHIAAGFKVFISICRKKPSLYRNDVQSYTKHNSISNNSGANSRLFAGRVYSLHEPRIYLYDQSEGQNSGFPAISRYLSSVEDYIDYINSESQMLQRLFWT